MDKKNYIIDVIKEDQKRHGVKDSTSPYKHATFGSILVNILVVAAFAPIIILICFIIPIIGIIALIIVPLAGIGFILQSLKALIGPCPYCEREADSNGSTSFKCMHCKQLILVTKDNERFERVPR